MGPSLRLLPTTAATTLRKSDPPLVIDGPFAETKEQLLGFYLLDSESLDEALAIARELGGANPGGGLRDPPDAPVPCPASGSGRVTDLAWIDAALTAARPQAVGRPAALLPRPGHRRGSLPGRLPAGAEATGRPTGRRATRPPG